MCGPWAQLYFVDVHHREHLFRKIYCPKHAQNFCGKGCHFGVAWKKILIERVQARQGKLGLQIWITLQVNYFKLPINGQIRGIYCEWRAKDLKVRLKLAKNLNLCLNSRNNSVIFSLYWFKSLFGPVARTLFRQRKWAVSSPESCVFHKDNFNLNARMVS